MVEARILNLNKRELFLICVCNRFLSFCQDQLNQNRLGSEAITLPKQDLLNKAEFIDNRFLEEKLIYFQFSTLEPLFC